MNAVAIPKGIAATRMIGLYTNPNTKRIAVVPASTAATPRRIRERVTDPLRTSGH
jgi:hypothetical protein